MIESASFELYVLLYPKEARHFDASLKNAEKSGVDVKDVSMGIPLTRFDFQIVHPGMEKSSLKTIGRFTTRSSQMNGQMIRKENQANKYVQNTTRVYEAIEADFEMKRMTALDRCARMAELALQAMGVDDNNIKTYFSNGAGLLGY